MHHMRLEKKELDNTQQEADKQLILIRNHTVTTQLIRMLSHLRSVHPVDAPLCTYKSLICSHITYTNISGGKIWLPAKFDT